MKIKFLLIGLMAVALNSFSAQQTATVSIAGGGVTNLVNSLPSGAIQVSQITLLSTATTAGRALIYDCPTNVFMFTNAAYTQPISYATNWISTYTNYYGYTNSITNVALIDTTITVASNVNWYPLRFVGQAGTNSSATFNGSWVFNRGIWATNATIGGGVVQVQITYQQ